MVVYELLRAAAPFVGRVSEIGEITHRLNNPNCRLLTLAGPGGIGKTRLAVEIASQTAAHVEEGCDGYLYHLE